MPAIRNASKSNQAIAAWADFVSRFFQVISSGFFAYTFRIAGMARSYKNLQVIRRRASITFETLPSRLNSSLSCSKSRTRSFR